VLARAARVVTARGAFVGVRVGAGLALAIEGGERDRRPWRSHRRAGRRLHRARQRAACGRRSRRTTRGGGDARGACRRRRRGRGRRGDGGAVARARDPPVELHIPPVELPIDVASKLEYADDARGYGRVSVLLRDASGAPAKGRALEVSPGAEDVEVAEIAEVDYPGMYVIRVRWKPGRRELPLSIAVAGSTTNVAVALPIPRG
jgi:hypothetical protein